MAQVLGNNIITPRITERVYRRLDGSIFSGFQITFGKSYITFDKVFNTGEEAKEWIRQVEATISLVNVLHRSIF